MNKLGVNFTVDDIDDAYLNATFETVNDILTHIESKFNKSLYEIFNMTEEEEWNLFGFINDFLQLHNECHSNKQFCQVVELNQQDLKSYTLLCGIIADIKVLNLDVVQNSIKELSKARAQQECAIIFDIDDIIYILDALGGIITVINEE